MDEIITALFSLGLNYYDVPLDRVVALSALAQLFTLNSQASCGQIVETVSVQSVHPPLFFCWMHGWMGWVNALPISWVLKLRAFPALVGVVAIAAIYQLNRTAFSRSAGLAGAAMMAVSPFAVYLSQEARHYTLPMLLVALALWGLYQILVDLESQPIRLTIWLGWIAINSLGFYVHYFFLLAFIPQTVILGLKLWPLLQSKIQNPKSKIPTFPTSPILLAIAAVCLTYLPWFPTFLSHMGRPETDWMKSSAKTWLHAIAPLYQIPLGWMVMVVALPVEQQPVWTAIPAATVMLIFSAWLVGLVGKGLRMLWRDPNTHRATWMLLVFLAIVILEFLAIAYLLGKDITLIPRYNFIYFPAICALLGASLNALNINFPALNNRGMKTATSERSRSFGLLHSTQIKRHRAIWMVVFVGLLSSFCVTSNLVFQKSYNPDRVARDMEIDPTTPMLVTMAYSDFQDVALGLSFALELQQHQQSQQQPHPQNPPSNQNPPPNQLPNQSVRLQSPSEIQFVFMAQFQGYEPVWQNLAALEHPLSFPLNLWAVSPGLKRSGYHAQLTLRDRSGTPHTCLIDPAHFHRIGIPYQLYRCR
jgi:uncharacterized membrane protein